MKQMKRYFSRPGLLLGGSVLVAGSAFLYAAIGAGPAYACNSGGGSYNFNENYNYNYNYNSNSNSNINSNSSSTTTTIRTTVSG